MYFSNIQHPLQASFQGDSGAILSPIFTLEILGHVELFSCLSPC